MKIILLFALLFFWDGGQPLMGQEKISVGLVEEIILLPWMVKIPARIDTGAAVSSLDVRGLTVKGKTAEFNLSPKYGGERISVPIVGWQKVRSAESRERRPIIEIDLCVGPKKLRARINLNDRSQVRYPFLIGRDILKENFVVDCMKEYCNPPSCPDLPPK
jgi:hypothetical protein